MSLSSKLCLKAKPKNPSIVKEPLWKGPEKDGITQSMLCSFMECRERFRLKVIEGLAVEDRFNHRMEYGTMWHLCEEVLATGKAPSYGKFPQKLATDWEHALFDYAKQLCQRYPLQQEQVVHWHNVCKTQFPIYVDYWKKHPDVKQRKPLMSEQVLSVPYPLPHSKRVVRLRGKIDGADLLPKEGIFIQENKTKGDIDDQQMKKQLSFDLQTMFYPILLQSHIEQHISSIKKASDQRAYWGSSPLAGVRYNVVRRPLSGGRHSIQRHKPSKSNPEGESAEEFYNRLGEEIKNDAEYFFMRWKVIITPKDIQRFQKEFLDNQLEELCNWYAWVTSPEGRKNPFNDPIHWRTPYGFYSSLLDGGGTELDEYLASGSQLGLRRITNLFPELT